MKYAGTFRESGHDRNHSRCILSYRGFAELPFWQVWFLVLPKNGPVTAILTIRKRREKMDPFSLLFPYFHKQKRRKAQELLSFFVFQSAVFSGIPFRGDPDATGKTILFLALITLQQIDCFLDNSFSWQLVFWGLLALIATDFSHSIHLENSPDVQAQTSPGDVGPGS
jgi:hypothetical protein